MVTSWLEKDSWAIHEAGMETVRRRRRDDEARDTATARIALEAIEEVTSSILAQDQRQWRCPSKCLGQFH